jgi:hypothetical protein
MTECLTSSEIETRLEHEIAHHPGCRGFQVEVKVRRAERGPHEHWDADFYATGDVGRRVACEEALLEILADAREDFILSLDS